MKMPVMEKKVAIWDVDELAKAELNESELAGIVGGKVRITITNKKGEKVVIVL